MWDHSTATSCLQHTHSLTAATPLFSLSSSDTADLTPPQSAAFSHDNVSLFQLKRSPAGLRNLQITLRDAHSYSPVRYGSVPWFLPGNRSEPCETQSKLQVSTNTLRLAGDKHLPARLCCRATPPAVFSLYLMPPLFVFSSSQATPRDLLLGASNVVERLPQTHYYTF